MDVWFDRLEVEAEEFIQSGLEMVPETLGDQVVENWINHAVDGEQALASQKEPLV